MNIVSKHLSLHAIIIHVTFTYIHIYISSSTTYTFKEHGSYGWNVTGGSQCPQIYVVHEPTESYLRKLQFFYTI